jgi:hypothetical protein
MTIGRGFSWMGCTAELVTPLLHVTAGLMREFPKRLVTHPLPFRGDK